LEHSCQRNPFMGFVVFILEISIAFLKFIFYNIYDKLNWR
jgi:hypothetical protein